PKEPFRVVAIRHPLGEKKAVSLLDDKVLDRFHYLAGLETAQLNDAAVTDQGLDRFLSSPAATTLTTLDLHRAWIGDAGLASLRNAPRLDRLDLAGCPHVGDGSLRHSAG